MPKWEARDNVVYSDGVVYDRYDSATQAQKAVVKFQTCEHKYFGLAVWSPSSREITFTCDHCAAEASFSIPANLEWK